MACHYRLWAAYTVERRWVWHAIFTFGLTHTVRRRRAWHAIIALGLQARSNNVGHGMPSSPLGFTHRRTRSGVASHHRLWTSSHCMTASGVACHHRLWVAHMVERCQAWHDITTLGLHARSDDVGRGMTSPPLDNTHGQKTSSVA